MTYTTPTIENNSKGVIVIICLKVYTQSNSRTLQLLTTLYVVREYLAIRASVLAGKKKKKTSTYVLRSAHWTWLVLAAVKLVFEFKFWVLLI